MTEELEDPFVKFDSRVESYQKFFDGKWAAQINNLTRPAPKLSKLIFRLTGSWYVASNTAMMPWLLNESLRQVTNGYNSQGNHQGRISLQVKALRLMLMRELNQPTQVKLEVCEVLERVAEKAKATVLPAEKMELPPEFVWKHFINLPHIKTALWGSQQQAFAAVYFPYDLFIGHCVRRVGGQGLKVGTCDGLKKSYLSTFGQDFVDAYVMHQTIHEARLVRHAIVHNGGSDTDDLRTFREETKTRLVELYILERGQLHIYPMHVKALFHCLKDKVTELCKHLVMLKEFGRKS